MGTERMINVRRLTDGRPFCAGVVLVQDGCVAVTLNRDIPPGSADVAPFRVGGVGGGQEPGETIEQCALREAAEELGAPLVELVTSPLTVFHDMDDGGQRTVRCSDDIAPLLLQRRTNPTPDRPYKPGLPTGRYIYYGMYLARVDEIRPNPEDDVAGVLFVPLDAWGRLEQGCTFGDMMDAGARFIGHTPIDRNSALWLPANESMRTVVSLIGRYGDLVRFAGNA